jgi:DNA repair exonuclease SbcCD ATPase subunit
MRAKKEAVSYVKGALLDCVTRQGSALALIRAFETTVASKLAESVQVAAKHSELEAAVAERDTRIAELEAETEAAEEGFTEQHGVVVEMESAVQSAADRIKELEEAVAALDAQNQAVEDDRLLAVGHAEELASEVAALKQKEKDREQGSTRLQTEREKLSVEITALQGQSKSLTRDLEKASHERDRFREHLEEARSELSETRERLRNAQKAVDDSIARSTSTATDLMDKNAGYLAQINALVAEKGAISARADEGAREVRALKESETGLNRHLATSLLSAAALGEELAGTRARLESASALAARLPSVEEGLSVATGRLEEAEKKLAAAAEAEAGWRAKELEWIAERAALTASGTAAAEQAAALGAELSSLKSSLGASQDSMAARMATQAREAEELRSKARTVGELRRALMASEASLGAAKDDLFSSEMERRRLHNMIQELKGNIRVYVRVRPTLPADADPAAARALAGSEDDGFVADPTTAITVSPDGTNLEILPPPMRGTKDGPGFKRPDKALKYGFDHVFSSRAGQEDVFNEVTHLVQSGAFLHTRGHRGSSELTTPPHPTPLPRSTGRLQRVPVLLRADGQRQDAHYDGRARSGRRPHPPLRQEDPGHSNGHGQAGMGVQRRGVLP